MIENLFKWISKSKITTIGYNHKTEHQKDLILNGLKSYNISEIYDKDFNTKQLFRDLKLDKILNGNDYSNFIHLDINDINPINKDQKSSYFLYKSLYIKEFLRNLRHKIDNFNFILTTETYNSFDQSTKGSSLRGGSSVIYSADLVFYLDTDKIKIIKNRYYHNNIDISLSDLENFNYICNYESNK